MNSANHPPNGRREYQRAAAPVFPSAMPGHARYGRTPRPRVAALFEVDRHAN
jgi:hypothetical protein